MEIHDNEHDPEQDPEYFTPEDRRKLARFITACVCITLGWTAVLVGAVWAFINRVGH